MIAENNVKYIYSSFHHEDLKNTFPWNDVPFDFFDVGLAEDWGGWWGVKILYLVL